VAERKPATFAHEVSHFRDWTRATRQRPTDWGSCYPHWERICAALDRTLAGGCLPPEQADAVLDLLVHDRQAERILERLGAHPMLAFQVAALGARHPHAPVRESVVPLLGRLGSLGAVELLHELCHDAEPTVRRHARSTLAAIDPGFPGGKTASGDPGCGESSPPSGSP